MIQGKAAGTSIDEKRNTVTTWASLIIAGVGLSAQLLGLVLCMIGEITYDNNQTQRVLMNIAEFVWAFLPLISLIGLIHAVKSLRVHSRRTPAVLGLLANAVWLAAGCCIWYFGFIAFRPIQHPEGAPTNAPTVRRTRVTATAYALAAPWVPVRFAAGEA